MTQEHPEDPTAKPHSDLKTTTNSDPVDTGPKPNEPINNLPTHKTSTLNMEEVEWQDEPSSPN